MRHRESAIQKECVRWYRLQYPYGCIFAIPNGGQRSRTEAAIMKGEGVMAGVADLFVMQKNGKGLFIEMKTAEGVQTAYQKEFENTCKRHGYGYAICRGIDDFIHIIKNSE